MFFQGIRTGIAKKLYIFAIFRCGGSKPTVPPPPLDQRKIMVHNLDNLVSYAVIMHLKLTSHAQSTKVQVVVDM